MNEEICCITNDGKTAKNEWENDDSDFLWALYSVYKKIRAILFPYFTRYTPFCWKLSIFWKVNKWSIKTCLRFFKNTVYIRIIPLIKKVITF